jgi:hypothetical protein
MLMRVLSLLLVTMFIVQPVTASETTRQGLKTIYDEFHYAIAVEWDQKDKSVAKKAEQNFQEGLEELRKQGLTNEELVEFASSQFKDEKVKTDFNSLMLQMKISNMSPKEVNKMVNDIVKESYQRGASWNGDVGQIVGYVFIGLILAGMISIIVYCTVNNGENCPGSGGGGGGSSSDDSDDDWDTGDDWDDDWSDDWCTDTYVCDYYYDEYGEWSDCYYECW